MAIIGVLDGREEMIKKYIPLVKYIASRVIVGKSKYIDYEDLVGYGMIGLIDALNKFDESKGMKFSTYASIRIKGAMIDELRKNSPISKGAMDKLNKYNFIVEKLQKELLREPTYFEIASGLGVEVKDVIEVESYINYISVMSLEDLIFSEDDDMPLIGTIEDKKSPSPERSLEEKEEIEYLTKALDLINEKDKTVLSLYYYDGLTLKQIGSILGVSESRVCQLHTRAIMHLRKQLKVLKYE
ncbi:MULTISPECIES: FliA/WhiG family RNA polymerase sigma factor [Clostridium]|uniref:FliA/WhiG family RNA polymerase sigma factor n=1 Tax=Clostridium TaxID=1485 RepID=UPI00069F8F21|nr:MULTISPECIES: FliA/WhiG family RNA polymerase sigma factor [Clostridium]KOF55851.1 RNA polymerase sigma factor [Clostridium sp. DMHC 10]MCD2345215.1 FliA/WhiG family RNA polymerase sigma factor [Clostridium guangxiense]